MREALTLLAQGDVVMPLRTMLAASRRPGVLGLMPSYLGGLEAFGVKASPPSPANFGTEYDTHQGVVLCFDTEHGLLRAIVDATSITAIRTAAVSGLVTDLLARPDAGDFAIIGAGTQAHTHLQAMRVVGPCDACVCSACRPSSAENSRSASRGSQPACRGRGDGRRGGRRSRPDLHDDDGHRAGRARRLGQPGRPRQRGGRLHADHPRAGLARSSPAARLYADRRESLLSEAGEFLSRRRGPDRRRPHRRRDRRGIARRGRRHARRPTRSRCSSRSASPSKTSRRRTLCTRPPPSAGWAPGSTSAAGTSAARSRTEQ